MVCILTRTRTWSEAVMPHVLLTITAPLFVLLAICLYIRHLPIGWDDMKTRTETTHPLYFQLQLHVPGDHSSHTPASQGFLYISHMATSNPLFSFPSPSVCTFSSPFSSFIHLNTVTATKLPVIISTPSPFSQCASSGAAKTVRADPQN